MTVPLESKIKSIKLISYLGDHEIELYPQVAQVEFYESLFQVKQQAVLSISDPIGLFNNFPLIGEEFVTITFENTSRNGSEQDGTGEFTYAYIISSIEAIEPSDRNRDQAYIMRLSNIVDLPNNRISVQRAFNGPLSVIVYNLIDDHITQMLDRLKGESGGLQKALEKAQENYKIDPDNVEGSYQKDSGTICIPNLRALDAAHWLAGQCVPEDSKNRYLYLFWQARDGFHFETIQKLLLEKEPYAEYTYYSDNEIVRRLDEEKQLYSITNISVNSRIKNLEKMKGGYFQNTMLEMNMMEKKYRFRKTEDDDYLTNIERDKSKKLNRDAYIETMKIGDDEHNLNGSQESVNRVYYTFNNRQETDKQIPFMNKIENWGNRARTLIAFDHVDVHITIPGDPSIEPGEIIECRLPKIEGFNAGDGNDDDKLIFGKYLVSDVKNIYQTGVHSTVLRINKDTYSTDPDLLNFEYGQGSGGTGEAPI